MDSDSEEFYLGPGRRRTLRTCHMCGGTLKQKCRICDGKGEELQHQCPDMHPISYELLADAYVLGSPDFECDNYETEECKWCEGTGEVPCQTCNGRGELWSSERVD